MGHLAPPHLIRYSETPVWWGLIDLFWLKKQWKIPIGVSDEQFSTKQKTWPKNNGNSLNIILMHTFLPSSAKAPAQTQLRLSLALFFISPTAPPTHLHTYPPKNHQPVKVYFSTAANLTWKDSLGWAELNTAQPKLVTNIIVVGRHWADDWQWVTTISVIIFFSSIFVCITKTTYHNF